MRRGIFAAALALSAMASNAAYAGEGVAIGLKGSTLGIGLEVVAPINDYFNGRIWGGALPTITAVPRAVSPMTPS